MVSMLEVVYNVWVTAPTPARAAENESQQSTLKTVVDSAMAGFRTGVSANLLAKDIIHTLLWLFSELFKIYTSHN